MARTIKLASALQAVFNVLENKGRNSEEFGDLLRKIKETQSIQNQAVINAAITQWEEENPELWQDYKDYDYGLVVNGIELARLRLQGRAMTVSSPLDEDGTILRNLLIPNIDPTDKDASIERLQRSIGKAITRRISEIHDTLFKVYPDA